jgi:hypothetical protein
MSCDDKNKNTMRTEISASHPHNGHKDALKYYKAGHNNG